MEPSGQESSEGGRDTSRVSKKDTKHKTYVQLEVIQLQSQLKEVKQQRCVWTEWKGCFRLPASHEILPAELFTDLFHNGLLRCGF